MSVLAALWGQAHWDFLIIVGVVTLVVFAIAMSVFITYTKPPSHRRLSFKEWRAERKRDKQSRKAQL